MRKSLQANDSAFCLNLRQVSRACFHALVLERPLIARVHAGVKHIVGPVGVVEFGTGSIGTLPPRQPLTVTNVPSEKGPYQTQALVLDEEFVTALQTQGMSNGSAMQSTTDPRVVVAFEKAAVALMDPTCPPRLQRHAVEEVLLWLAEFGIGFGPLRPPGLVDRLRLMIDAAPDADWRAGEAASRLGVSEATMRRRLAETGMSFSEILADVRMAVALGLLQTSDLSVTQVAYAVGYASPSRFAIRFRTRFGIAPSELRYT